MALTSTEWLILAVLLLLLFGGATMIPRLAKALGRAQGEFKRARADMEREMKTAEGAPGASEEQIRRTARDLGIDEQGKSLDEVKRAINERLA
ncbi:MAG TPA: twin-arginine translocase TatA/TatE family subunit [Candidatus Thermoplasmatota archaeon]|nr:twin-arginine translocase TatA/TatE family subunit [Candidatus Thermoplasmatota archaeon]